MGVHLANHGKPFALVLFLIIIFRYAEQIMIMIVNQQKKLSS